jgi:cyclopropane-fatty-acyl-phospholipid synthase
MSRGCLEITFPDGRHRILGEPGTRPSASIQVRDVRFFKKCALFGAIGLGESYVDGDWDTPDIERVIEWFIMNTDAAPAEVDRGDRSWTVNLLAIWNRLWHLARPNSKRMSRRNIARHYDLGNDFYSIWLDPTMTYSSAIFSSPAQSLEEAQRVKYDALCRRLRLNANDKVLEIGCGWGGFAEHAARNYGCHVTAVTISKAQFEFAKTRIANAGLAGRVEIRLQDYRDLDGRFDKIASIEMMEALGARYLEVFLTKVHALLAPEGLAAFQYITVPDSRYEDLKRGVDWIQRYIFPGSLLLSVGHVSESLRRTGSLFLHSLEDYGLSYASTLRIWQENFNRQLAAVKELGFDDSFIRKWNYYLSYCAAAFAMRNISVVQAVYTRPNNLSLD